MVEWLAELGTGMEGFHQSVVVGVPAGLTRSDLTAAWQAVLDRHDALRMRLDDVDGLWQRHITEPGSVRAADVIIDSLTAVPEPGTAAALLLGLSGLAWLGRRRPHA